MMKKLTKCLSARLRWYEKSIAMKEGKIPYENGFDFPDGDISAWQGASRELKNTLDMLTTMKKNPTAENREKNCVLCGTKMVWEHPDIPGLYMESSCYIGTDCCYDCMREHCQQTNCLACEIGEYPNCRHQGLKKDDE